ncbi:E2F-associated phosphoprotein-like [Glandiceps talaboti]
MAGYDEYCVFEESDDEDRMIDSSDDELEIILHGTPKQKRRLSRSLSRGSLDLTDASSSGDEFEKEVEAELDATMKSLEEEHKNMGVHTLPDGQTASTSKTPDKEKKRATGDEKKIDDEFYDDIYFDSDIEDEEDRPPKDKKQKRDKRKHKVLTNDELFYDPNIDDENERWVEKQREKYRTVQSENPGMKSSKKTEKKGRTQKNQPKNPTSDAVLNCPACMALLCLDCQRHDVYVHQFRAMFVVNCAIVHDEILRYKEPAKQSNRNRKQKRFKPEYVKAEGSEGTASSSAEEIYHPVRCSECNTEVAVYDSDEVFHFHNVLASAP